MSDFLQGMAISSAARAAQAPSFTDADFDKPVVPLSFDRFGVIAEIKRRSPAEGQLESAVESGTEHLVSRAQVYAAGGAAAGAADAAGKALGAATAAGRRDK